MLNYSASNYSASNYMAPAATVESIGKCSTLVDYVQFKKWKTTECYSKKEQFQVSASYAMGIIFNHFKGEYKRKKPGEVAPSFFRTGDKVRLGCYNYGHGIVYEGCWVTYDDKIMNGSSKRKLPGGKSFTVLCETKKFRKWFSKVLNGAYEEHDFDQLPLDVLISLTSPNSPGSLASDKPAGSSPSAGPSIPNNQLLAAAHTGATVSILQTSSNSQHGSSLDQSSNRSVATAKEGETTSVQDDSQPAGDASVKPSDKATTSMKRQIASPLKSSLEKRTKTGSVYQRQEIIDISSGDEDNVKLYLDDSQSSSNATQIQKLKREIESLKLSKTRVVDKIENLMQENTNLKLSEMRAVNRANEALGKLRAANRANEVANRANEVLSGNEDLVAQIEELIRENASLKLSAFRPAERADDTADKDEGRTGGIKNEGITQKIKNEDLTGQLEE